MNSAAVVTLIGVAIIVGALAVYLTIIALTLRKVSFHLGTVLIGVRAIANQTEPVGEVVGAIAADIDAIQKALEGLVAKAGGVEPARRTSAARSVLGAARDAVTERFSN